MPSTNVPGAAKTLLPRLPTAEGRGFKGLEYRRQLKTLGLPLGLAFGGFEALFGDQLAQRAVHAVKRSRVH